MADITLASAAVSAAIGAATAALGAGWKNYLDSRRKIDEDLRERRDTAYSKLWPTIVDFAIQTDPATYSNIRQLNRSLAEWYRDCRGGLYLSRGSQKSFDSLLKSVDEAIRSKRAQDEKTKEEAAADDLNDPLTEDDIKKIDAKFQALRTSLTGDLLSYRSGRRII